jgi:hypothetical protein
MAVVLRLLREARKVVLVLAKARAAKIDIVASDTRDQSL